MFAEHLARLARALDARRLPYRLIGGVLAKRPNLDLARIRKALAEFSGELEMPLSETFEVLLKRGMG